MAVMPEVDRRSVAAGAVVAIAVIFPIVLLYQAIDAIWGIGCESNLNFVFFIPVVAGWIMGGFVAAKRQPPAAYTHAALAALAAFAVFAVVRVIGHLVINHDDCGGDLVYTMTFNAFVAASAGILGAIVAGSRR